MEKKISAGVRIVGISKITFATIFLIWVGYLTLAILGASPQRVPLSMKLTGVFMSLFLLTYIINSFFLLMLKKAARTISIILDASAILIDSLILIPGIFEDSRYGEWSGYFYGFHLPIVAIFLSFIYYLTRSKVKEQFK